MKKTVFITLAILLLIPFTTQAQKKVNSTTKGHDITFTIQNSQDEMVFLAVYYREKLILQDSAKVANKQGNTRQFIFKGDKTYQGGLYKLVSQKHRPYLDFVMDKNQNFSVQCDTIGNVENIIFINSPENLELHAFQKQTVTAQKRMSAYRTAYNSFEKSGNKDSVEFYKNKITELNKEMEDFIKSLISRNPDYLFSKMQKAYRAIVVPDPPVKADGTIDSTFQARYYLTHYWDNIDLSDSRLIFTPLMEPKMKDYFNKALQYQEADTINKYVDMIIGKTTTDTLMYRYMVDWITYNFETSKVLGHDAVFVHVAKNNQLQGKCTWMDEDLVRKYEKRVKHLEPLLIGKKAAELIIPDTSLTDDITKWHSSYNHSKKYVILWFYDPDCPTCKKESEKLRVIYDSLENIGKRNFDVYGVGNDADIPRWKKYVKDQNYPWINVGGNKANVDYLDLFNIYESGNPAMFILDENNYIILNKRIEMNTIQGFIEQHEKMMAYKKNQKK